jgi:hypothetical protein
VDLFHLLQVQLKNIMELLGHQIQLVLQLQEDYWQEQELKRLL